MRIIYNPNGQVCRFIDFNNSSKACSSCLYDWYLCFAIFPEPGELANHHLWDDKKISFGVRVYVISLDWLGSFQ